VNFRRSLIDLSAGTSNPRQPSPVFGTTSASDCPHRIGTAWTIKARLEIERNYISRV
jgi:hypothetical protein